LIAPNRSCKAINVEVVLCGVETEILEFVDVGVFCNCTWRIHPYAGA
jgi:hypothetical protein